MKPAFAIVSDLHANVEAVTAVFDHIAARKLKTVYCLGDVVGYGPEPAEVCDIVRKSCEFTIRGNHDDALFNDPKRFNQLAKDAISYTRDKLRPGFLRGKEFAARWEWLRTLPLYQRKGADLFVHGSPNDPVNEYVYQEDVFFNADVKLKTIFEATERATFCGHTHLPVVIGSDLKTWVPKDGDNEFKLLPGTKYVVNVGSVGQPRDRDPRSCYAEVDGDVVRYHRVPYDIAAVQKKILATNVLHELLARRLSEGI